jgi:hypothetical protein
MKKLLLAATTMLALSAPALAETIVATAKVDNVVVAVQSSASGTLNVVNQSFGPVFNLNTLTIDSQSVLALPGILSTNTFNVNQLVGGTHDLVIDIVAAGLLGPNALTPLLSTFSVSGLPSGWSIQEQTFIDNNPLADTGVFTGVSDSASAITSAVLGNFFNAEVIYTIHSVGVGNLNGGIDISLAPVPLPAAIWLFGGGLGVLGLVGRRRKQKSVVA